MKHWFIVPTALLILSACASLPPPPEHKQIIVQDSFVAAEARLREAIGARDLTLFTIIDHGAGAMSVGRDIGPSKLFIFGNPKGGTPLMEDAALIGLDLPLKVLIYTNDAGRIEVAYTNIKHLAAQYRIDDQDDRLNVISRMLEDVAEEAAG